MCTQACIGVLSSRLTITVRLDAAAYRTIANSVICALSIFAPCVLERTHSRCVCCVS